MSYNEPENILISDSLRLKIDTLKDFYFSFKEKHSEIFKDDIDDTFIDFNWKPFPVPDGDKEQITFDVSYSDKLPIDIKKEFENYLKKFLGK